MIDSQQYMKFKGERLRPARSPGAGRRPAAGTGDRTGCGTGPHAPRDGAPPGPSGHHRARPVAGRCCGPSAAAEPSRRALVEGDIIGWSASEPAALHVLTATLQSAGRPRASSSTASSGATACRAACSPADAAQFRCALPRGSTRPARDRSRPAVGRSLSPQTASGTGEGSLPRRSGRTTGVLLRSSCRPWRRTVSTSGRRSISTCSRATTLCWSGCAAAPLALCSQACHEIAQRFEASYAAKLAEAYPRRADRPRSCLPPHLHRRATVTARTTLGDAHASRAVRSRKPSSYS